MARAFAAELGRHSIRVNSLHPGAVDSLMGGGQMRDAIRSAADTYPYLRRLNRPLLPEGSAQPEDIADAVAWLASDLSTRFQQRSRGGTPAGRSAVSGDGSC